MLFDNTINLKLVRKYPIKLSYQKAFLKYVIGQLEKQGSAICDCLYSELCRLVSLPDASGLYYKHFEFEFGKFVSLKENSSIISEGTTGLCTWEAAAGLSDWCVANKGIFENKNVLELGSGVGLVGITVGKACGPKKVFLTDCHNQVLSFLRENVIINFEEVNGDNNVSSLKESVNTNTIVEVCNLPWETISKEVCREIGGIDVIIASDVVYDSSLFTSLVGAIKCFLCCGTERALLACTKRNPDTFRGFLDTLKEHSLRFEETTIEHNQRFFWPRETPVILLDIRQL